MRCTSILYNNYVTGVQFFASDSKDPYRSFYFFYIVQTRAYEDEKFINCEVQIHLFVSRSSCWLYYVNFDLSGTHNLKYNGTAPMLKD
jgi:hypothetical protein